MLSWFLLDSMYCDAGKVLLKFATKLGNETKCFNWCSRPVAEIIQIEWNREEEDWERGQGMDWDILGMSWLRHLPMPNTAHWTYHAKTLHIHCTDTAQTLHTELIMPNTAQCTLNLSCQTLHTAHCSLHSSPTKLHSEVFTPLHTICTIAVTVSTMVTACNVWLCKVGLSSCGALLNCVVWKKIVWKATFGKMQRMEKESRSRICMLW